MGIWKILINLYSSRKQMIGGGGRCGKERLQRGTGNFGGTGYVHYLDSADGFMGGNKCQNSSSDMLCILNQ